MGVLKVALVVHPGVQALDVAGPIDVFAETNGFVSPEGRYETLLVARDRAPLRASNNMQLLPDLSFHEAQSPFDLVLVAGGPDLPHVEPDLEMTAWLREMPTRAAVYGSICTGAFALGHAGLLDGRRVTTHWQIAAKLAEAFPSARVEPDLIYVSDGPLITSAGVTAGIDLALALVRQHHGASVAVAVAKRLVVLAQRQGGQSQFSPYLSAPADPQSAIARLQNHVILNVGQRHTLQSLAEASGMSPRNLARQFVRETGITPHEFVERARIDAARMLLEATRLPLKSVAFDCGFGTADRMRIAFAARLGVTPAQYRQSFQADEALE
ncbi:GlxA family transcriptional regulator [Novosphingobium sp. PP1Y]|uniref:GlxA family transcriptional regulator n=1 Tax=Novosphingobium sp. PP1Y TaxID=702113 RepID=UPI00020EEC4A|nr:GlxA family transcriptional regulator [Novosphingobium sp. PP1Y]CCA92538.1 AraC family transcriptional regulator [Novosphingobium sp. PP1Y]